MQQTFQCPRCGSQNYIGQQSCSGCDEKFEYRCINCGTFVDSSHINCPSCHGGLLWGVQTQTRSWIDEEGYLEPQRFYETKRERPKKKIIKPLLMVCLFIMVSISGLLALQVLSRDDTDYLLNKVVEWPDGTKERVQIDRDNYFIVDGTKKRLVGMYLYPWLPYGKKYEQFYLPKNLAYADRILTYLQSIGIRLIRTDLCYVRRSVKTIEQEKAAYKAWLDLIYKHKMFLIPGLHAKSKSNFGNLESPDFTITYDKVNDSLGDWASRWANVVSKYPNVVAVIADNELDNKLRAENHSWILENQMYTPPAVENHLDYLRNKLRKIDVPVTHNLMMNNVEPQIKQACLNSIDIPSFDCYEPSADQISSKSAEVLSMLSVNRNWWCLELNNNDRNNWQISTSGFNTDYIEAVFEQGATVAVLFNSFDSLEPQRSFFDNKGVPKQQLIDVAQNIYRLQAPILEPQTSRVACSSDIS